MQMSKRVQLKYSRGGDEGKEWGLAREGAGELLNRDGILKGLESYVNEFRLSVRQLRIIKVL